MTGSGGPSPPAIPASHRENRVPTAAWLGVAASRWVGDGSGSGSGVAAMAVAAVVALVAAAGQLFTMTHYRRGPVRLVAAMSGAARRGSAWFDPVRLPSGSAQGPVPANRRGAGPRLSTDRPERDQLVVQELHSSFRPHPHAVSVPSWLRFSSASSRLPLDRILLCLNLFLARLCRLGSI